MQEREYNFKEIEKKWQKKWADKNVFTASKDSSKKKYYVLEMFPYPSGYLHMGHVRVYCIGDIIANFMRMQGYERNPSHGLRRVRTSGRKRSD